MRIFVTGAGALLGQGIIKALKRSSLPLEIISADPNPYSAGLYWTDRAYKIPLARDPDYLERLKQILAEERPHAVLVGTDVELPILAANRTRIEQEFATHVLVSDPRVVAIADDKYLTAGFFRDAGFPYPQSATEADAETLVERIGFPLIVKPRIGARALGVSKVANREELDRALAGRKDLVIQECVGSDEDEYTASALVFDGRCAATIVMRRHLRDGNTYRAFVEDFPELNKRVAAWAEALKPHGPANFQFRLDDQGEAKAFEINARFSGTTPLRAMVGFNEVEMCLRAILLGEPVRQPAIEPAVILRHWDETLVRPAELAQVR
ncbi:MAG: ATP-grasp domain-containing protein [Amphiplicatus sp.]